MRIGTNVAAIVANNALQKSQNNLSTSIERLSSGYKINGSKDDAAGCAISEKMRAQIRGLSQPRIIQLTEVFCSKYSRRCNYRNTEYAHKIKGT